MERRILQEEANLISIGGKALIEEHDTNPLGQCVPLLYDVRKCVTKGFKVI